MKAASRFTNLLLFCFLLAPQASYAYQAFLTTGEILPEGQFKGLGYVEAIFDDFDGVNFNFRGAMSLSDELQADIELGFGELDLMLAGSLTWVPIPDYEKQPAIGARTTVSYMKIDDFNETVVTIAPFISKGFETDIGPFTPFIALPLGIANHSDNNPNDDDTFFTSRFIIGTEWGHPNLNDQLKIITELGFGLTDSFGSFNIGSSYNF